MKYKYLIGTSSIFALIAVVIISCKKEQTQSSVKSPEEIITQYLAAPPGIGMDDYNYVAVTYNQLNNPFSTSNDITLSANFSDKNSNSMQNAGSLSFKNLTLQPNSDNFYFTRLLGSDSLFVTQSFSSNIQFSFTGGTGVNALITPPVRIPGKIYTDFIGFPYTTLPKNQNLNLSWVPDNSTINHKMYIQVTYNKGVSQSHVPTAPNDIESVYYAVPDNGNYTITVNDLSRFPLDTYVGVTLARGYATSSTVIKRGIVQNLYSLAVVRASSIPLLIVP